MLEKVSEYTRISAKHIRESAPKKALESAGKAPKRTSKALEHASKSKRKCARNYVKAHNFNVFIQADGAFDDKRVIDVGISEFCCLCLPFLTYFA